MSISETGYDHIQVEEAIDNAYLFAEKLDAEYQEHAEKAIEMVETLPSAVNETGMYTEEEIIETLEGLYILENLQARASRHGVSENSSETVRDLRTLEDYLEETAFKPAREEGVPDF